MIKKGAFSNINLFITEFAELVIAGNINKNGLASKP